MDLDIEMGDSADMALAFETDTAPFDYDTQNHNHTTSAGNSTPQACTDDDSQDMQTRIPNKVHMRGLDTLTTDEIKAHVALHHGTAPQRVEWIDDTSANLLFDTDASARDAIIALSALPLNDPTQLPPLQVLPAKPSSTRPDVVLTIRFALTGDRKQAGAASRSRFYLLHPEYDPAERRRRDRTRYRDRSSTSGRYGGGARSRRERDLDEVERFDESFYDEQPVASSSGRPGQAAAAAAARTSRSPPPGDDRSDDCHRAERRDNRDKELFAAAGNREKELFPSSSSSSNREKELFPGSSNREKELFPTSSTDREKDLFPSLRDRSGSARDRSASPRRRDTSRSRSRSRSRSPGRRRYGRPSLDRDEARSRNRILGQALKDRITHTHSRDRDRDRNDLFPNGTTGTGTGTGTGSARTRIAGFNAKNRLDQLESVFGSARLESEDQIHPDDMDSSSLAHQQHQRNPINSNSNNSHAYSGSTTNNGFSIKGAASASVVVGTSDFSIKGSARKSARELFPDNLGGGGGGSPGGNEGKELFAGRTQRRQKAGDLFY